MLCERLVSTGRGGGGGGGPLGEGESRNFAYVVEQASIRKVESLPTLSGIARSVSRSLKSNLGFLCLCGALCHHA